MVNSVSVDSEVARDPMADDGSFIVFPKGHAAQARAEQALGPTPLPLAERVYPPRPPDAPPAARLQDFVPRANPHVDPAARRWPTTHPAFTWSPLNRPSLNRPSLNRPPLNRPPFGRHYGRRPARRKNVVLAGALGLFFGPLGMLYASIKAAAAAVLVGSVTFTLILIGGLAFADSVGTTLVLVFLQAMLAGPVCGTWAAIAAAWRNRRLATGSGGRRSQATAS